jgi:hypothetical protein
MVNWRRRDLKAEVMPEKQRAPNIKNGESMEMQKGAFQELNFQEALCGILDIVAA